MIKKLISSIIIKIYKLKCKNLIIRHGTTDSAVFRSVFYLKNLNYQ